LTRDQSQGRYRRAGASFHALRAPRAPSAPTLPAMDNEAHLCHEYRGKRASRSVVSELDAHLAALAERQHGVVARWQITSHAAGDRRLVRRLSRQLDPRLAASRPHAVHRGIYAVGHPLLTPHGRFMAGVLAAGPDGVLSHRSAATLWRLLPPTSGAIEVSRPTHARRRRGIVLRAAAVPMDERDVADGIPVTSVSRTILDLAAVVREGELERALNEMEVRGLRGRHSIPEMLGRHPGRRGAAALRRLLDGGRGGSTRSELEERFLAIVDAGGLPRPRLNRELSIAGRFMRPDFTWAEHRLIVETDGSAAGRQRRARDQAGIRAGPGTRTPARCRGLAGDARHLEAASRRAG
jgi:hypothetical protein